MTSRTAFGGGFAAASVLASLVGWSLLFVTGYLVIAFTVQITLGNPAHVSSGPLAGRLMAAALVGTGAAGMATAQWLLLRRRTGVTPAWIFGPVAGFAVLGFLHQELVAHGLLVGLLLHAVGGALVGHVQARALGLRKPGESDRWTLVTVAGAVLAGTIHHAVLLTGVGGAAVLGILAAVPFLVVVQTLGLRTLDAPTPRHAAAQATAL